MHFSHRYHKILRNRNMLLEKKNYEWGYAPNTQCKYTCLIITYQWVRWRLECLSQATSLEAFWHFGILLGAYLNCDFRIWFLPLSLIWSLKVRNGYVKMHFSPMKWNLTPRKAESMYFCHRSTNTIWVFASLRMVCDE